MDDSNLPAGGGALQGGVLARGVLLITVVLVAAYPAIGGYGYWAHGNTGLVAAAVAAFVCWLGGLAGLCAALPFQGKQAVNGVLLGMLVRMTVPLMAAAALFLRGGELVRAGLVESLVVYYLIALSLDTVVSVRMVRRMATRESKA